MLIYRKLFIINIIWLLCCLGVLSASPFSAQTITKPELEITFDVHKELHVRTIMANDPYYQPYCAHFVIKNLTAQKQYVWVMSCSYQDNWQTDSKDVSVEPQSCRSNAPVTIKLDAHAIYEGKIALDVKRDLPATHSFKIKFVPTAEPSHLGTFKETLKEYNLITNTALSAPISITAN